jgi:phenylpropionate dioxygenase-like ring-hydroxylating dioxygenase large terminal subunit
MTYLRNCWYFAGWQDELQASGSFDRTIAEVPLVFFRKADGSVAALLDRCPHRFAPLSRGKAHDGVITCGYHGIAFNADGRCVHNPHGPIASSLSVPHFPAVEAYTGVWVWLGEESQADPATIPRLDLILRTPPNAQSHGYEPIAAHYQLCSDNILDLSHADCLHSSSLGGGATTRAQFSVEEKGDEVVGKWFAANDTAPPALNALLPEPGAPADVYIEVRWHSPGVMIITFGAYPTGDRERGNPETWGIHIMTPQDASNTHYFYWAGRNCLQDDAAFNEMVKTMLKQAFAGEDKPMLEAQQRRIGAADLDDLRPALLRTDEASVRVRRRVQRLLKAEQASSGEVAGV